jgi:hypothetical protein
MTRFGGEGGHSGVIIQSFDFTSETANDTERERKRDENIENCVGERRNI